MKDYYLFIKPENSGVIRFRGLSFFVVVMVCLSGLFACQLHASNQDVKEDGVLDLSKSEKKWIAEHPEIFLGTDKYWEPYVIADRDGTISGIEADLIKRINEIAGTNIRIVLGDWPTIVEKAQARELDGLLVSTEQEKRAPHFLFTESRLNAYQSLFSTLFTITSLDDLQGKRVGYQRGSLIHENFLKQQSDVTPVPLGGPGELVAELQNNKIDAIIGSNSIMFFAQERMLLRGLKTYIVPESRKNIVYSIRKDWPELHSIINKALAQISHSELASIKRKYLFNQEPKIVNQAALSQEEQTWLQSHPDIKLSISNNYEPYLIIHSDGSTSGIFVDFIGQLNKRLGTNIQLFLGTLAENLAVVKDGAAAGILAVNPEHIDKLGLLKTQSYYKAYPALFVRKGLTLESPADLAGKKIVCVKLEYYSRKIIDQYGAGSTIVEVDSTLDGLQMIANGEAEVFVGLSTNSYLVSKYQLSGIIPKYVFFNAPIEVAMAVRPDLPELIPILNKGLATFSEDELTALVAKWINAPSEENVNVQLSVEEKAWLAAKHTVKVRVLDLPPFIISNKGSVSCGIAIDYLELLGKRMGIQFDYKPSTKAFGEALDGIKKHQGPDLIPAIVSSPERKKSILFTKNYITSPIMIFIRSGDKHFITKIDDLKGEKIAILEGSVQHNMVKKDYPDLELKLVDSPMKGMEAVVNEEADAYIGTLIIAGYHILHRGLYALKLAAPTSFDDYPFSMGVRDDWPELVSIMNKGFASISEKEHEAIRNRYVSLQYDSSSTGQYLKWASMMTGVALAIIGLFILWNRSLTKKVASSTAKLQESELRFRRVLESTSAVPWERDVKNDKYTYIGKQAEQMLGYPIESWTDKDVWVNRIHPEDRDNVVDFCENEAKKSSDFDLTYRVIHMDDSYRWIRDVVSVTKGQEGPTKLVGFMYDITEQKELALEREELDKHWEQAQKLEAVGTLAGGIAHDFNNILSAILGFTQLAKDGVEVGSEVEDDLNEVLHAGHRAKELVQQILAFSRQAQIDPVPLEPQIIVKEALKMLRSSLPATIEIKEDISHNCGLISAVPAQIHQILVNLCTNAFHAMEKVGGTMVVELKMAENIPPDLELTPLGYIELLVSDTGQGIEPPIIDKIFDPFFTTKEPNKGTGMGLSIIYGIVRDYGGRVTVESEKGQGTTFRVYLPLCEQRLSLTDEKNTDTPKGNERILFIDDENTIAKMGKTMLEKLGYQVTTQTDSSKALQLFQLQPEAFDLIITDQTMPGLTGIEIAKKVLLIRPDMPIILCTGYSSIVNEDVAQSIGIRAFTHKPISKSAISQLIRKVLNET